MNDEKKYEPNCPSCGADLPEAFEVEGTQYGTADGGGNIDWPNSEYTSYILDCRECGHVFTGDAPVELAELKGAIEGELRKGVK